MVEMQMRTAQYQGGCSLDHTRIYRVAYLVSHPIQYQAPLLRLIADQPDIELMVYFESDMSINNYEDRGFGRRIQWDVSLLQGYRHEFLPAWGRRDIVAGWRPLSYGIVRRLWRGNYDVLWVHGYARWVNWLAMIAARLKGMPVLVRGESTAISAKRSATKARLKRWLFRLLDGIADGFLAIGTLNRAYYRDNGIAEERIFLMPYCVDNERFARMGRLAAQNRTAFRAALGLQAGRPVILYASKLQERKRPGDLLAAYQRLRTRWATPYVPYLLFVGDGELRAQLEGQVVAQSLDGVRFLGFQNQTELPTFFDLCDVFVLPSVQEPWGLIVNEVMAAGRPVILSDQVGCAPDLVRNGVNGFIYPAGDVSALADVIGQILERPDRARQMGRASAEIISRWSFHEDLIGLRAALASVAGQTRRDRPK